MRGTKQPKLDYLEQVLREFGIKSERIIVLYLNPGRKRKIVLNALDDLILSDESHNYHVKNLSLTKINNLCDEVDQVYVVGEGRPKLEVKRRKRKIEVQY